MMGSARPLWLDPKMPFCASGKRAYPTLDAAERQLCSTRWQRRNNPDRYGRAGRHERAAYACRACGWYHLTATTSRTRRGDHAHRHRHSGSKR